MNQLQALLETATNRDEVFASKVSGATLLFSYATDGSVTLNKRGQKVLAACRSGELSSSKTAAFQVKKMDQGVWIMESDIDGGHKYTQSTFVKV